MSEDISKKKQQFNFPEKPKIGFYLGNGSVPNADLRFPENGNPGIGGSEFAFVTLPYFFSLYYDDFDLVIFANITDYLPNRLNSVKVADSTDAARKAIQDNCKILIIRLCDRDVNPDLIQTITGSNLKVIVWAHNYPSNSQMDMVSACPNVSRLVCVGHEELDLWRDHSVFSKTTCIFNGIYLPPYLNEHQITRSGTTVVYLGSLVREKGFHILAKVWPQVKAHVPEANLKVIGTGTVYNENTKLGRWGIASEDYEQEFRPFLSDKDGNLDRSVEFLGKIGAVEKISIMQRADIGIVNPNWDPRIGTETCSMSTVEFQACGTPVISAAEDGSLDTILHRQTGLLNYNECSLTKYIVKLLRDKGLRDQYGRNAIDYIRNKFEYSKICQEWRFLFYNIINNKPNEIYPMKSNVFYHYKFLREIMRIFKHGIPRLQTIPAISAMASIGKKTFLFRVIFTFTGIDLKNKRHSKGNEKI
jgi:glycosyltransferase involved in cell wall biosynthesis